MTQFVVWITGSGLARNHWLKLDTVDSFDEAFDLVAAGASHTNDRAEAAQKVFSSSSGVATVGWMYTQNSLGGWDTTGEIKVEVIE